MIADRPVAYSNIAVLVKAVEDPPMSASEDDAVKALDHQVQRLPLQALLRL